MNNYQKTTLQGGLRVVSEEIPQALSVSIGIWVTTGSSDETPQENGAAHLIEHMIFKGTKTRTTLDIARESDRLGGLFNAFTSKETTCFHNRVRSDNLPEAVDLLLDMFQNSLFDETELAHEKDVIIQEIAMVSDEPEEYIHDLKAKALWPDHPLGLPVTGTVESVKSLTRPMLMDFIERNYDWSRVIISAAGNLKHKQLLDLLVSSLKFRETTSQRTLTAPTFAPKTVVKVKPLEQAHLVLGTPFPSLNNPKRYAASVLNLILGGNMSSRLFQEIRERRALAYSVYSHYEAYNTTGTLDIYLGASPENITEAFKVLKDEISRLKTVPLSEEELSVAVDSLKTALILGSETVDAHMSRLAKNEINFGRFVSPNESFQALDEVTVEQTSQLARQFFDEQNFCLCFLGPRLAASLEGVL
ncbi:MAG: M16 family metallopeptidase [Candidatus Adiutrix sp.]